MTDYRRIALTYMYIHLLQSFGHSDPEPPRTRPDPSKRQLRALLNHFSQSTGGPQSALTRRHSHRLEDEHAAHPASLIAKPMDHAGLGEQFAGLRLVLRQTEDALDVGG